MTPFENTNRITSAYGYREYLYNGVWIKETHRGQDIVPTKYAGEPVPESAWQVREVTGGRVLRVTQDNSRGRYVDIQTAPGVFERYQHMKSIAVKAGQAVLQGEVIGIAGNTGKSTGRHLHFGVYKGGNAEVNAVPPQLWSGLPNAAGTYGGNDTLDSPPPPAQRFVLNIGPMSGGDKTTLEGLAKSLGIPVNTTTKK